MNYKIITVSISLLALILSAQGMTPPEQGAFWKELSHESKYAYVLGVIHGGSYALEQAATEWLPKEEQFIYSEDRSVRVQRALEKSAVKSSAEQLVEGMDYLYSDPANVYVGRIDILYFARDRALGKDITESLNKKRREALEHWKIILQHLKDQKVKNK
jgi:hypothetical protein